MEWSPDGQMLAAGDDNGTICIISSLTGNIEYIFEQNVFQVISLAWSPDGKLLVSGDDNGKIWFWEIETKRLKNIATVHNGKVKTLVWSSDGKIVASIANDLFINLWDVEKGNVLDKLQGHSDSISSLSWSPSESKFASGSLDRTIYIWDLKTRKPINIIESHTSAVVKVAFSDNGQVLATQSNKGIIKIWKCDNWQLVSVVNTNKLSGKSDYHPKFIEFHPLKPIAITINEVSKTINIWKFEFDFIPKIQQKLHEFKLFTRQNNSRELLSHLGNTVHQLSSENDDSIQYINAKVVLIGESGVGKSGLGIRLAEKEFRATESTHGANFWQLPVTQKISSISKLTKVKAELTLWDLAGQPDYHLVHQLFLKNTDIALLLFDCSDASNPFRGVPYWAKVLKKLTFLRTKKYLVSSRCDVSPVTVSLREINKFLGDYALDHHFQTSAKTGEGTEQLLEKVINNIPWDKLLRTTTLQLFQVREFLLEQKEKGEIFITLDKIISRIERLYLQNPPSKDDINTAVKLLQNSGFVYRLNPTPKTVTVLLRPELINKYASSVIQAARRHPDGIGSIEEREVVCANLPFYEFSEYDNLSAWDEKQILESTVELLIDHNLGFREMGRLIFPSQLNIRQEIPADQLPPTEVTYEFSGSVEAIYASLVVCLSYTKDFQREQLWKYAAEFSRDGHRLGFAMQQEEGTGELEIYFYEQVTDFDRVTFIRFIQDHLHKKGIDLKERIRLYCPECDEEVKNRKAIKKRVKEGKLSIKCQYCDDVSVLIPRSIEEKYRSDRAYIEKQKELQDTIKERTRQEVIAFREDREQYMSETDKQIRILHLSDIHLGTSDQAKNYFAQLATDLTQNLKVKQLNYLVLSGDIANYSTVEEYDAAFELVDKLVNRYGLNPDKVITVPGNHDLNWDLSEEAYDFVPKRKLPKSLSKEQYIDAGGAGALIRDEERYQQRFKHFSDRFYKKVYGKPYPLEYDQQAILHPCPDDKILFLALNSCWELDHHYKDRASIKSGAIAHAVEQILTGNYDDWLKIAVWHHPVTSAESMKNADFLEQLAANGFQVAMHGHIHEAKDENFKYDINREIRIIAAGTFGAPVKEQVTGIPLQYNLLVLNPDNGELTVETRKKQKVDGAWSADARWGDKSNNPSPRYVIPLKYGAGVKKSEDTNPSQPSNQSDENPSNNPSTNKQSILDNVSVGGNLTVGNITQISNSSQTPPPNPSNVNIDNRTININQGNYNESIGGDYIQGNRGEEEGKKQN